MRNAERAGHGSVVFELVGSALLCALDLAGVRMSLLCLLTFNRLAVSGSIMARTSFTSWPTLEPTSPAPMRMTMLLGSRLVVPALPGPVAESLTLTCVLFFVRGFAILATRSCRGCAGLQIKKKLKLKDFKIRLSNERTQFAGNSKSWRGERKEIWSQLTLYSPTQHAAFTITHH